jgi:hypothetical protein
MVPSRRNRAKKRYLNQYPGQQKVSFLEATQSSARAALLARKIEQAGRQAYLSGLSRGMDSSIGGVGHRRFPNSPAM